MIVLLPAATAIDPSDKIIYIGKSSDSIAVGSCTPIADDTTLYPV